MANKAAADPSKETSPARSPRKLRWVLGWIVLPGSLLTALFLAGVHVGARHPDMALARLLLHVFGAEAGVADKVEPHTPEPTAKP